MARFASLFSALRISEDIDHKTVVVTIYLSINVLPVREWLALVKFFHLLLGKLHLLSQSLILHLAVPILVSSNLQQMRLAFLDGTLMALIAMLYFFLGRFRFG